MTERHLARAHSTAWDHKTLRQLLPLQKGFPNPQAFFPRACSAASRISSFGHFLAHVMGISLQLWHHPSVLRIPAWLCSFASMACVTRLKRTQLPAPEHSPPPAGAAPACPPEGPRCGFCAEESAESCTFELPPCGELRIQPLWKLIGFQREHPNLLTKNVA